MELIELFKYLISIFMLKPKGNIPTTFELEDPLFVNLIKILNKLLNKEISKIISETPNNIILKNKRTGDIYEYLHLSQIINKLHNMILKKKKTFETYKKMSPGEKKEDDVDPAKQTARRNYEIGVLFVESFTEDKIIRMLTDIISLISNKYEINMNEIVTNAENIFDNFDNYDNLILIVLISVVNIIYPKNVDLNGAERKYLKYKNKYLKLKNELEQMN